MKVRTRKIQMIGIALYMLPFLAVLVVSSFFVWAGDLEMVVTGVALLPAVLFFCGVRWCRYVVGVIAALGFLACLVRVVPALTMDQGRYFWVIWSPIWLVFGFSAVVSFMSVQRRSRDSA